MTRKMYRESFLAAALTSVFTQYLPVHDSAEADGLHRVSLGSVDGVRSDGAPFLTCCGLRRNR